MHVFFLWSFSSRVVLPLLPALQLIVYENLETNRYVLKNGSSGEEIVKILDKAGEAKADNFHDAETGTELEVIEKVQVRPRSAAARRVAARQCCAFLGR